MLLLGHFIEFLESRAILGLPFRESIGAASMYDSRGRTRAGELRVLAEHEESVLLHKDSVGKQLLSEGDNEGMPLLSRWAILQNCGRSTEDDKSVCCALAASYRAFDAAEELATGLALGGSLRNRSQQIRSENGQ